MKIRVLAYIAMIYLLLLFQTTVLESVRILGVKPNLLMLFIVSAALMRGSVEGAILGFFTGLAQDLFFGRFPGLYSLLGMYLGFIVGSVDKRIYKENYLIIVFFSVVSTLIYESCGYYSDAFLRNIGSEHRGVTGFLWVFRNVLLPESIYNGIVIIPIHALLMRLDKVFTGLENASKKY